MGKRNRYPGVTRLKKGLYEVRIQLKKHPRTGRSMEARRHVMAANAEEAWRLRMQLREELLRGDGDLRAERPTLGAYASEWLLRRAVHLAESTADRYADALELHLIPNLGDIYLDCINRRDVELFVARQAGRYAPETVNGHLRILKTIMADAADELSIPNPCTRVKAIPTAQVDEDDPNALTEEELQDLLAAFEKHQPQYYPLVLTIALTGLRWGEASALKWGDLDRDAGVIRVRRAHYRGHVKPTKTGRPRLVPLPCQLLEVLDEWRTRMLREQQPGLDAGWLFPGNTGELRTSNVMTKPMRDCLKKAGIDKRVTVQGLRRSAEDVLRRLGVSGALAEALMGHNARMRSRYSTVDHREVASLGPRLVRVLGLEETGRLKGRLNAPEKENASLAGNANEAFSKAKIRAGDGI